MSNTCLLIKNYFFNFIHKLFKNKKASGMILPVILLSTLGFSALFSFLSYYSIVTVKNENPELAIYSFSTTGLMFAIMLIATEGTAGLKSTDEELLLSLPIKKWQIILSKIIYYFVFDFIVILLLLFPSYIIYGIVIDGAGIDIIGRGFIFIVCISLVSNGISGIIHTIFVRLSKRFKYSDIIQTIFSLTLVIIFVITYIGFMLVSQNMDYAMKVYDFYPIRLFSQFVLNGGLIDTIIMICIAVLPFAISVLLRTIYFGKSIRNYHSHQQQLIYEESTIGKTLFKKEINKYLSIPVYVTNTMMGLILGIGLIIAITIIGKESFSTMIKTVIASGYENGTIPISIETMIDDYFSYIVVMVALLTLTMVPTTACSISIEGKEMWILKAHPISVKDVFLSKLKVNISVTIIPICISSILLGVNFGFAFFLVSFCTLFFASLLSGMIGLFSNLLFPKLEWESELEPVKQGIAVLLTMVLNFVFLVLPLLGFFFFSGIRVTTYLILISTIYVFLIVIFGGVLAKKGVKLYLNI